jgi:hypothetical protein
MWVNHAIDTEPELKREKKDGSGRVIIQPVCPVACYKGLARLAGPAPFLTGQQIW